jgi:hypothetical protein
MTWRDDLNYGLAAFGVQIPERVSLDDWSASLAEQPFENTAKIVAVTSVLFYLAERGHNPKVNSIYDASVYCSTCLSVGYADIFARTPVGKMIGTFLMTIGPSISGKATDGRPDHAPAHLQEQILSTLREIAAKLPQQPQPPESRLRPSSGT